MLRTCIALIRELKYRYLMWRNRESLLATWSYDGTVVVCPQCGWRGSVPESMKSLPGNDSCPECGETRMTYEILPT